MTSPNLHLDFFYFMQPHDNVLTCSHNLAGCNCLICVVSRNFVKTLKIGVKWILNPELVTEVLNLANSAQGLNLSFRQILLYTSINKQLHFRQLLQQRHMTHPRHVKKQRCGKHKLRLLAAHTSPLALFLPRTRQEIAIEDDVINIIITIITIVKSPRGAMLAVTRNEAYTLSKKQKLKQAFSWQDIGKQSFYNRRTTLGFVCFSRNIVEANWPPK